MILTPALQRLQIAGLSKQTGSNCAFCHIMNLTSEVYANLKSTSKRANYIVWHSRWQNCQRNINDSTFLWGHINLWEQIKNCCSRDSSASAQDRDSIITGVWQLCFARELIHVLWTIMRLKVPITVFMYIYTVWISWNTWVWQKQVEFSPIIVHSNV